MAAGEQQRELVIAGDDRAMRLALSPLPYGFALLPGAGRLTAQVVDGTAASDRDKPSARVVGDAVARPLLQRPGPRLLRAVLGHRQVADQSRGRRRRGPPLTLRRPSPGASIE